MSSTSSYYLPTLDKLNASIPPNLDASQIASDWFKEFSSSVESANIDQILFQLVEDAFWRDILSITWDFRTIYGSPNLRRFLEDRIAVANLKAFTLERVDFFQPYPDLAWIQGLFSFDVGDVGAGTGVFRIIPTSTGEWKGHCVYTNLESLKEYPEKVGSHRNPLPDHGKWSEKRRNEQAFVGVEPYVLVIGGGHCGLEAAARLKFLDIPTLIIEREARIGDKWRARYDALCLNDPVWCNHLSYIPFPPTWPTFAPAKKFADWLEFYAHSLELNVWLSSTVSSVRKDPKTNLWDVVVRRGGEKAEERVFHPVHVIFAVGLISPPYIPEIPGKDGFEGLILHSTQYKAASDHIGKKVVVVGAGTSGHDISADCVEHGVDVTMYQRSSVYIMSAEKGFPMLLGPYQEGGPPTAIADRMGASYPLGFLKLLLQRSTKDVADADKELLDGLTRRGFKINFGDEGSGLVFLNVTRAGGYYMDHGASQLIVDGKIKLKSDSVLERFTKHGVLFEDGSQLEADVVIFATGFSDFRNSIREICGDEITDGLNELGGLNEEYETNSFWRHCGVDNLWFMTGSLAVGRHHSKHLALQIKAIKEGVFGKRYSL